MTQKPQLRWGAGEVVEGMKAEIREAYCYAEDTDPYNQQSVKEAMIAIRESLHRLTVRIDTDLRPMLQRADKPEPTLAERVRVVEIELKDAKALLSTLMQLSGQTL